MADATQEQSAASTSIAQRVEQIANMVEETTRTIRGTTDTAHQLEDIANNLKGLIGRFRIRSLPGSARRPVRPDRAGRFIAAMRSAA